MPDARAVIEQRLVEAFDRMAPGADPVVRRSDHADFQANGALGLAKSLGRKPRDLAEEIVAETDLADLCTSVEISGRGFIILMVADDVLARLAEAQFTDPT